MKMTKASKKETSVTPISQKTEVEKPAHGRALSSFEDMERMFDEFFSRRWMRPFHFERPSWSHLSAPFEGRSPQINVVDRDDEIFVKAELPGVDKDDVEISMTGNSVTIKGSTRTEEKEEKGNYHRCEISEGSFSRTVSLPAEVETEKAKAKFKHGVLELSIPKLKKSEHTSVKVE